MDILKLNFLVDFLHLTFVDLFYVFILLHIIECVYFAVEVLSHCFKAQKMYQIGKKIREIEFSNSHESYDL